MEDLTINERYVLWQIAGKGGARNNPPARNFASDPGARKFSAQTFARLVEKGLVDN